MTTGDFVPALICKGVTQPTILYIVLLDYTAQKLCFRNFFYIWEPQHLKGPLIIGIYCHWSSEKFWKEIFTLIDASIDQSINQSISQSVNQSINI